eukprot:6210454-Pleurochrysis_carterae.AAC.1
MSSTPLSFSPPPPPTIICTTFRDNPCTYEDGVFYAGLGESLGLTEFDATSVNWAKPVFWGNGDNCSMDNQDGCLIPLGAGCKLPNMPYHRLTMTSTCYACNNSLAEQ